MATSSSPLRARLETLAPSLAFIAIAWATIANLRFVIATGERLAFIPRMTADAESYVRNAQRMIADGDWLVTSDTYHSVGGSLYAATALRIFGSVLAIKIGLVSLLAASLSTFYVAARRAFASTTIASFGVALLASSVLLARYCAVVQYEIVVLALYTTMLLLASSEKQRPLAVGILSAVAATFRVHFGLVFVFSLLDALLSARGSRGDERRSHLRRVALVAVGFSLVAIPLHALYWAHVSEPFFFQSVGSGRGWLRRLHANATGVMWPYPPRSEPHGLAFIAQEPGLYARFLVAKVQVLFGMRPDVWFLESRWVRALAEALQVRPAPLRTAFGASYGALAVAGWVVIVRSWSQMNGALRMAAMQVAAVLLPQWIVGSSTRVLVPIVPALLLMQLVAMRAAAATSTKRAGPDEPKPATSDGSTSDERSIEE